MASYHRTKYSVEDTQRWTVEALVTLGEEGRAMTCAEIKACNILLADVTPQKMARCLNDLCERGLILKTKGKDNRMLYKSVSVILEEGYKLEDLVY